MNIAALEKYLHQRIPASLTLGIRVLEATKQKVVLNAPIALNINHKKTVFGGSLQSVATLSCWCLLFINIESTALKETLQTEIVISESNIKYLAPVTGDFSAKCSIEDIAALERFKITLTKRGMARINLHAIIHQDGRLAVDYHGTFVGINNSI